MKKITAITSVFAMLLLAWCVTLPEEPVQPTPETPEVIAPEVVIPETPG